MIEVLCFIGGGVATGLCILPFAFKADDRMADLRDKLREATAGVGLWQAAHDDLLADLENCEARNEALAATAARSFVERNEALRDLAALKAAQQPRKPNGTFAAKVR